MGLFGKKNIFLGIDFGASSIKVVELTFKNQRPELTNYGYAPVPDGAQRGEVLAAILKKMKPRTRAAYVALPGSSGLVTLIAFPQMSHAELAQAVSFEARKHIPVPLEEVNVSWDVVAQDKDLTQTDAQNAQNTQDVHAQQAQPQKSHLQQKEGSIYVLLVAAPRKDVAEYESYIAQASVNLHALELETFSLVRALVGEDMGRFLIADIGAHSTNIILVEKGVIRANRNVGIGGANITHSIVEALGLDAQRAEAYKHEQSDLLSEKGVARQSVDMIVEEMRRVGTSHGTAMADNIIITGGGSNLKGIDSYIGRALGTSVALGNPWARITVDDAVARYAEALRGTYTVAVGLALRGVEEYRRS